ncbi:MAG TPA: wax ester/triacylglycerol synthase family O-acyltransferase, partial [Gemmatimonadales bacterium]|nr:wax ester/triacylglycerol synthase family O-acyltransferase [Gemmatimonadales bacterium]
FDLRHHVVRARLPRPAGKRQLEALVGRLASTPLARERPLWQFHLVDNYGGGSAVVVRIHHCYADGIALVQVMLSLTHPTARGSLRLPARGVEAAPATERDFWDGLLEPVYGAIGTAADVALSLLGRGQRLVAHPLATAGAVQEATRTVVDVTSDVAKLALMGADAPTRFKGPLAARRRVAWAEPLPLDEVKAMGKALGASINDVLLSMAAGALRDYLRGRGDAVEGLEIRAVVPVNLRPQGEAVELGNRFGMVFLDLPLGIEHPLERLYEVRRRMRELKGSYQPAIALLLLQAIGSGPRALQDAVTAMLARSASLVMTNVPGPRQAMYLAGKRIADLDFWVPQAGGIGLGLSILSYDGRIHFGAIADEGLVPDPAAIVARFAEEFERLLWLTLMSPWDRD